VQGTFLTGRTVGRAMAAQGTGGSIVNMSSINASLVIPGMSGYVSSKGGVQQLTRLMAIELAPHAIRVNAIGPGSVGTEMAFATYRDPTPVAGLNLTKEQLMFARTPIGRMADPLEIASIASFLLGDDSSYVTGETIQCDGARAHLNGAVPIPHGTVPVPESHHGNGG
jgi:glucose 1-dehydrogenase